MILANSGVFLCAGAAAAPDDDDDDDDDFIPTVVLFSVMILISVLIVVVVVVMMMMMIVSDQQRVVQHDDIDYQDDDDDDDDDGGGGSNDDGDDDDVDFRPTAVLFSVTDTSGAFLDRPKLGSPFTISFNVDPTSSTLSPCLLVSVYQPKPRGSPSAGREGSERVQP